jgi:hypothetical protein
MKLVRMTITLYIIFLLIHIKTLPGHCRNKGNISRTFSIHDFLEPLLKCELFQIGFSLS